MKGLHDGELARRGRAASRLEVGHRNNLCLSTHEGMATVSREAAGVAWNVLGKIRGDAMLHAELTLKRATQERKESDERP
jgi:hypothetical protein